MTATTEITIRQPDDFHVHLRDGDLMKRVLPYTADVFGRALVMPNLTPPILTGKHASSYQMRIMEELAGGELKKMWGQTFYPMMTIKLTGQTTPDIIKRAKSRQVVAAKLYPAGVTTNSEDGVSEFNAESLHKVFETMAEEGMVLCVHAETPNVPSLERETNFVTRHVIKWATRHPDLKIVIEHATTRRAIEIARDYPNIACSLTVHHMLLTLDDVIGDKLDPHCFCKPIAKTEDDRQAIIDAAVSGHPSFFFGSDSAPHVVQNKHTSRAAAGCFTAPVAMQLLVQVFDERGALNMLEMFVSENGANFYGLPLNEGKIRLVKESSEVVNHDSVRDQPEALISFWEGKELQWRVAEVVHKAVEA